MQEIEVGMLKELNAKKLKNFPILHSTGLYNGKPYMILSRLGQTLEFYQMMNKNKFSFKTVHQIGI